MLQAVPEFTEVPLPPECLGKRGGSPHPIQGLQSLESELLGLFGINFLLFSI